MEDFINQLNTLYANATAPIADDVYFDDTDTQIHQLSEMACDLLIDNAGRCNISNMRILRAAGYFIFAGEKDSFGWLTGCIQKIGDHRILVYG